MIDVVLFRSWSWPPPSRPTLTVLLVLRALFGFAMGGEWGIGASLALETHSRRKSRGVVSGLLQEGYPCGFLLASIWPTSFLRPHRLARACSLLGVHPGAAVLYIRRHVPESPGLGGRSARPAADRRSFARDHDGPLAAGRSTPSC